MKQKDIVIFHYFDDSSHRAGIDDIFKSFLTQILLSVPPHSAEEFSRFISNGFDGQQTVTPDPFGQARLVRAITSAVRGHRRILIAVDALDKCHYRHDLLSNLVELSKIQGICILITSEQQGTLKESPRGSLQYLSLEEERSSFDSELRGYFFTQLCSHKKFSEYSVSLRYEVVDTVLDRARGM